MAVEWFEYEVSTHNPADELETVPRPALILWKSTPKADGSYQAECVVFLGQNDQMICGMDGEPSHSPHLMVKSALIEAPAQMQALSSFSAQSAKSSGKQATVSGS